MRVFLVRIGYHFDSISTMKKPQPFSLPARLQRAYDLIAAEPRSQTQLAEAMNITQGNAATALHSLRVAKLVRVADWSRCPTSNRLSAIYAPGDAPAAPKPKPLNPIAPSTLRYIAERKAKTEARRAAREAAAAAAREKVQQRAAKVERARDRQHAGNRGEVIDALGACNRLTAAELADVLSLPGNTTRAILSDLRYLRKVYIAGWTRQCPVSGVQLQTLPIFALGSRNDAKRPKPLTSAELGKRRRAKKREAQSPARVTTLAPASVFHLGAMMMQAGSEARA